MKISLCILVSYLVGTLSPAALISKLKHKDLRKNGTGNLGASNTLLVFGKKFGVPVMLLDILKGFLAVKLTALIFPEIGWVPMASGLAAVIGHCFPFYMRFKGGKGLAAFGGVILAYHPILFVVLLSTGVILMIVINHSVALPYYAAMIFPVFVFIKSRNGIIGGLATAASLLIMVMHFGNILKALYGTDIKIRPFIKNKLFKRTSS